MYTLQYVRNAVSSILTVRVSDEVKNALEQLADATGRSKSFLAFEAIKHYLQRESWQVRQIKQGISDADAGRLVDHAEVVGYWEKEYADSLA